MDYHARFDKDFLRDMEIRLEELEDRRDQLLCELFELVPDLEGQYKAQTDPLERSYTRIRISDEISERCKDLLHDV